MIAGSQSFGSSCSGRPSTRAGNVDLLLVSGQRLRHGGDRQHEVHHAGQDGVSGMPA